MVKLGTIAVDGTKVKANASRHKAMSYGHMLKVEAELKAQIAALLQRAKAADEAEKNEPELDVPAEIARRQDRLNAKPHLTGQAHHLHEQLAQFLQVEGPQVADRAVGRKVVGCQHPKRHVLVQLLG